jgi:hypothetical protein
MKALVRAERTRRNPVACGGGRREHLTSSDVRSKLPPRIELWNRVLQCGTTQLDACINLRSGCAPRAGDSPEGERT